MMMVVVQVMMMMVIVVVLGVLMGGHGEIAKPLALAERRQHDLVFLCDQSGGVGR